VDFLSGNERYSVVELMRGDGSQLS
jgi:hypothetical protein